MQIEAFKAGEPQALRAAVEDCLVDVWCLARRGFYYRDPRTQKVEGIRNLDTAERVVTSILTAVLEPANRQIVADRFAFRCAVFSEAKRQLIIHGTREGLVQSDQEETDEASALTDVDQAIATGELEGEDPPVDIETMTDTRDRLGCVAETIDALPEQTQRFVRLRWNDGQSLTETAKAMKCGTGALRERERKLRRKLQKQLRTRFPSVRFGEAVVDALASGQVAASKPPAITLERITRDVLARVFQEEPAPYSRRLTWGLATAALAGGLWTLMFLGILPNPDVDKVPTPSVALVCEGPCAEGSEAEVVVVAPRDHRQVAIFLRRDGQPPEPLLVDPQGRSVTLPLGAKTAPVALPYRVTLPTLTPDGRRPSVLAFFSESELSSHQILAHLAGATTLPNVLTTSSAIAPERR